MNMLQPPTVESNSKSKKSTISPSERQNIILDFMEEYESAEEDEKVRLLVEFENNRVNNFQLL